MSSPRKPDIASTKMNTANEMENTQEARDLSDNNAWDYEESQWGDEAMLEWNAPSGRAGEQVLGSSSHMLRESANHKTTQRDLDRSMGSSDREVRPAPVRRPPPKMVALPKMTPAVSAEELATEDVCGDAVIASPKDPIQALLDRGMPDYASWSVPDLKVSV